MSLPDKSPYNASFWGIYPINSKAFKFGICCSPKKTLPVSEDIAPVIKRIKVVLPEPDGPISPKISFSSIFNVMSDKIFCLEISSGGFALLFNYTILIITHIQFRKKNGKPEGTCRLCGFPYSSLFTLFGLLIALFSMPFVPGQTAGFFAGISLVAFFSITYLIMKFFANQKLHNVITKQQHFNHSFSTEFSEELHNPNNDNPLESQSNNTSSY